MNNKKANNTLSANMLIGMLLQPIIPKIIVQKAIDSLTAYFTKIHPGVVDRMSDYAPARIVLNPTDMPFYFLAEFTKSNFHILYIENDDIDLQEITTISATFDFFLKMLERQSDGDALFFSRQLMIEGDTTIVVALRNILEAENVNINDDINETFGTLSPMVNFIKNLSIGILAKTDKSITQIKQSIVGKLSSDHEFQKKKYQKMKEDIHSMQKQVDKLNKKIQNIMLKQKKDVNE